MSAPEPVGRLRAYWQFLLAVLYFFLARSLAHHAAMGLAADQWVPLVEQAILAFLLVMGYAALGFWLNRQLNPISVQGLPRRQGWQGEVGLGLATGWGLALVCVLLLALGGGIAISISARASAWGWLLADAAFFALAALAEEVAFRGYGFQRFVDAVGPIGASLGFAAYYAIVQSQVPGSGRASIMSSVALGLLLSAAYSADQGDLAQLGAQLWLEGQPRPALRARSERRKQPFACRSGRSDGPLLAYRRRLRLGGQLGYFLHPHRRAACRLPHHPRAGFPL